MAGGIAGAAVFAGFTSLGILMSGRLGLPAIVPILIMSIAGAYGGWLVGVIVFSAVRGAGTAEEKR